MEYSDFVQDLPKVFSPVSLRITPENEYTKEFEQRMEALVINYDVTGVEFPNQHPPMDSSNETKRSVINHASTMISPVEISASLCCIPLDPVTELMYGETPRKKKAISVDQESQCSFESSEGISMRYDSCSSNDESKEWGHWADSLSGLQINYSSPKETNEHKQNLDESLTHEAIVEGTDIITMFPSNMYSVLRELKA
ncbi:uncharacterized protein LOC128724449 [Anopheles nili]|uniref:uncharacterized protein LOC128724449 n=1 Tax=Anopheles nili TaxID=185578 RepID=UPI00237C3FAE|nr:uncharacterized protein LOC128724449 [Anopheles nili]